MWTGGVIRGAGRPAGGMLFLINNGLLAWATQGLHTDDGVSLPGLEIILPLVQQVHQILAISLDICVSAWERQILHLKPFALETRDDAWVEIMRVRCYKEASRDYVPFILAPVGAGGMGRLETCRAGAAAATPSGEMLAQSIHCNGFLLGLGTNYRPDLPLFGKSQC